MTYQAYDALMDHLAALAVTAVQQLDTAVQVYWLNVAGHIVQESPSSSLTLDTLLAYAQADLSLSPWAQPLAPQALAYVLGDGMWLETSPLAPFPPQSQWTWGDLTPYGAVSLRLPQAYRPYAEELWEYARCLWQAVSRLYGAHDAGRAALPEEVLRGVVLFEAGLYFACHEYFETLWGRTADAASDFYHGLIQVAVAMRHLESHNVRGAIMLLRYGMGRLQRYPALYKGLAVASFVARLEALLAMLEQLETPAAYQFDPLHVPAMRKE